jgi:excinuclease UvrABC nuclease subunit
MKMCLAPCFKGCSDAEYHGEVSRVQTYFDSGGQSLFREISLQREQASSDLAFEEAASHHARLEKLKPVLGQVPEIVRRIDRLSGLVIQPSASSESVAFFRFDHGYLSGPIDFAIASPEHTKSQSMEARVLQALDVIEPISHASTVENMEHLAILKRWYYRGSRVGEIFLRNDKGELPLRRIVRGISRVYRGEKADAGTPDNSESMRLS